MKFLRISAMAALCGLAAWAAPPDGDFLYLTNYSANQAASYRIDAGGTLNYLNPAATGASPWPLAVDPGGRFVYVGNAVSGDVSVFKVDANGGLVPSGAPTAAAPRPFSLAVDTMGRFLFVALEGSMGVRSFQIGPTGALTLVGTYPTGEAPTSIAVSPLGFVFVAAANSDSVWTYRIGTGGQLTSVGAPAGAGFHPRSVTVDPSGKFVWVANLGSHDIWSYAVDTNGVLTHLGAVPVTDVWSVLAEPHGHFLYAGRQSGGIAAFAINTDGSVTSRGMFNAGTGTVVLTTDQAGRFAFAVEGTSAYGFQIESTGALTPTTTVPYPAIGVAASRCTLPPTISNAKPSTDTLWPPNHKMESIQVQYQVTGLCGAPTCHLDVASNQPTKNNTADWYVVSDHEVLLRAERDGNSGDRQYSVRVKCEDPRLNVSAETVTVTVPHDRGH